MVQLLPLWQLEPEVRSHRQLRALADVEAGQRQIRHTRTAQGHPVPLRVALRPRHLPAYRESPTMERCACLTMNGVGEPCAGEPHARFDRGPLARIIAAESTSRMGDKREPRPASATRTEPAAYLTIARHREEPLLRRAIWPAES